MMQRGPSGPALLLGAQPKAQWTDEPPLMDQTHGRLLWNGQEQSFQEALPNLWLCQGLYWAPTQA